MHGNSNIKVQISYTHNIWRCSRIPRPTPRWKNDIKTDLREMRWKGVEWIEPALKITNGGALMNTVKSRRVPYNTENSLTGWETVSFSIRTCFNELDVAVLFSNKQKSELGLAIQKFRSDYHSIWHTLIWTLFSHNDRYFHHPKY